MGKRILIIILVVLLLVVLASVVLYLSITNQTPATQDASSETDSSRSLFPFLNNRDQNGTQGNAGTGSTTANNGQNTNATSTEKVLPVLRPLWDEPVAGVSFATDLQGKTTIRFIERATGNIYETSPTSTATTRLTNTTIPRIQEVVWPTPDQLFVRYLRDGGGDVIETFAGHIVMPTATSTSDGELRGSFLPTNIAQMTAAGSGGLFYLTEGVGARGIVSSFDGSAKEQIFSSPIRDWLAEWVDADTILLTTKASNGVLGHALFLSTTSGSLTPVLVDLPGLTTNVEGDFILYSIHQGQSAVLTAYNLSDGTKTTLPVSTLAEKCTARGVDSTTILCAVPKSITGTLLPDEWYQGVFGTNDTIQEIDLTTATARFILEPSTYGTSLDAIDLIVDSTGHYLLFRDKRTGLPWLFTISEETTQSDSDKSDL